MAPRIKIPAHVFGYSLALTPAVAYAMYWKRNHQTDEELEEKLKQNYSSKIQGSRDKKQDMVKFFAAVKDPASDPEQEKKMQQVLYGGRGDIKRHYAVDEKLYGTEEGVEKRKMAEVEQQEEKGGQQKQKRKDIKKKKKKRKKKKVVRDDGSDNPEAKESVTVGEQNVWTGSKNVVAIGAVGAVALVAVVLGGKRS